MKKEIELSEFDTILATYNNFVYGYRFLDSGECEFLTYDISTSKTLSHGKSELFTISTDSVVLQDNTIYIPIALLSENDKYKIYLYSFDNQSQCTAAFLYESESPLAYLRLCGESILISHTDIEKDLLITSIDTFDVIHNNIMYSYIEIFNISKPKPVFHLPDIGACRCNCFRKCTG